MVWEEGRIWYELKESGLHKFVFGDYGENDDERSWNDFIKEAGVPKSTVEMRIRLHQFWVLKSRIPIKALQSIQTRKLDRAIPFLEEGKQKIVDVIENAKVLNYNDFMIWLRGNEEPCHHPRTHRKRVSKQVEVCGDCEKELRTPKGHKH